MKIKDATFCIVDTETTGLDYAGGDRIVEIAARTLRIGCSLPPAEFSSYVNPERDIPATASAVHHIIGRDVVDAPPIATVLADVDAFVGNSVLVAHNAKFDRTFLPTLDDRRWLCTERLAHHLLPDAPAYKNQVLRYLLGGEDVDLGGLSPHRALADVRVTAFVLEQLIAMYERLSIDDNVEGLVAFAALPYLIKLVPMGKFYGKPFSEPDIGWLRWAWSSDRGKNDPDFRYTIEQEVARRRKAA